MRWRNFVSQPVITMKELMDRQQGFFISCGVIMYHLEQVKLESF